MELNHHAIWLFARDMHNIDFDVLKSNNVTDIFLSFASISNIAYRHRTPEFLKNCSENGIRVSLWTQALYVGRWFNPSTEEGKKRVETYLEEVGEWINVDNIDGIHVDYIRYPGTALNHSDSTSNINSILKSVNEIVRAENENALISAAVMPEGASNERLYGQNYTDMSKYVDVLCPMVYTGNYNAGNTWLKNQVQFIVDKINDCDVWAGLQTYASDNNITRKSANTLRTESEFARGGGAKGIVHFRFGLIDDLAFNKVGEIIKPIPEDPDKPVTPPSQSNENTNTIEEVLDGARRVKEFIENNSRSPQTVRVGDNTVTRATFNRMMGAALLEINSKRRWNIMNRTVAPPSTPSGNLRDGKLQEDQYLDIARRTVNFIGNSWQMPNFISSVFGNVSPFNFMDIMSRILTFYLENKRLPVFAKTHREFSSETIAPISGSHLQRMRDAMRFHFTNATQLYNRIKNYPYAYYYNNRYNERERYSRIANRQSMNCVDWALALRPVLLEMNYQVLVAHGQVRCRTGWKGHVWLEIRGREFPNWVFFDATAAKINKYNVNRLVCSPHRNRTYNPAWFMNWV